MSEFLKGNFKVKNEVRENPAAAARSQSEALKEEFRKKALASICGSMVYVERTELTWNGDDAS